MKAWQSLYKSQANYLLEYMRYLTFVLKAVVWMKKWGAEIEII